MLLARVVGNMISTIKHEKHKGMKLLLVEYLDADANPVSSPQIAVDEACAGAGDIVLVNTDGGAANILLDDLKNTIPIDCVICGVVDHFNIDEKN